MVEILSQVCQDEEIKDNLNKQSSTAAAGAGNNSNSPDYKNLRERLLKEVVSSTNAQLVQNKPKPRTIFDNRPNLTANFLFDSSSSGSVHSLKGVPASSQENSLLQELLYTLLGNSGDHITPVSAPDNTVTFTLDKSIDQSLASLLQRLLPLAAHYSAVVSWCEDTGPADGLVNQALVAGINLLLSDYTMLICQLEQSHSRGELTLHRYSTYQRLVVLLNKLIDRLHHQLQSSKQCLEILNNLVTEIQSHNARGGATLSILHSRLLHCGSDPKSEKVVQFLTELAAKPFFDTLSKWLYRGVIVDPGRDFFVEDHEVVNDNNY